MITIYENGFEFSEGSEAKAAEEILHNNNLCKALSDLTRSKYSEETIRDQAFKLFDMLIDDRPRLIENAKKFGEVK